jgi:hypothetical protein
MMGRGSIFVASVLGKYYAKDFGDTEDSLRCGVGLGGGFHFEKSRCVVKGSVGQGRYKSTVGKI